MEAKKPRKKSRATRAPRGTGTVIQKGPHLWIARKPNGTRINGRGQRVTAYIERAGRTQAEAIRKRDAALPPGPRVTVAEWCDRWLPTAKVREQSRDEYAKHIRLRIKPDLGHLTVASLTPFDIEEAAQRWGSKAGAGTVRNAITALSAALQAARRARLVTENAARGAIKPKSPAVKVDPFTVAEMRQILAAATARNEWRVLAACAGTGCRIGEALALADGSYNPATGRLAITSTRTRQHGDGPTKSARSTRTITVPTSVRGVFAALPFPRADYTTCHTRFGRLLKSLGIRRRNPHQLRHSVATHLIAKGVPLADVAAYLGQTVAVLVRTYCHPVGTDPAIALDQVLQEARKVVVRGSQSRQYPKNPAKTRRVN
jgi:integrase